MRQKRWMQRLIGIISLMAFGGVFFAQTPSKPTLSDPQSHAKKDTYVFTVECEVPRTHVKNQSRTLTCWDFGTTSFFEAELLRLGKGEFDLSEMFLVRHVLPLKAENFVRRHGNATFSGGGQAHDVIDAMKAFGAVPESAFSGMTVDENRHNHQEMSAVLEGMLAAVVKQTKLTPRWKEAVDAVVETYLGKTPETFTYKNQTYTPLTFRDSVLGLPLDDYVEITSFTHHPFYSRFSLEIPDNWNYRQSYYNVPLADLETILDNALHKGYSVCWDGDNSERSFSFDEGVAFVPAVDPEDRPRKEQHAATTGPEPEKEPTQELRQKWFENYTTTDDHLEHMVGIAKDQKGTKYYLVKDSFGTNSKFHGYEYLSRSYVLLKTVCILVHKDVIPADITKKLGL